MAEPVPEQTRAETERVRALQDKEAPRYDRQMNFFDRVLFAGGREWACSRLQGEVLEIALGTGRNLPLHRSDIALTGIELSPQMLAIAKQRASELGRAADLQVGDAQALDFPDQSFDSVLCTLAFCTIPDPGAAAREVFRVLRPGGRFSLLEHVRNPALAVRGVQRLLEPLTIRFEGDHLTREPLEYLGAAGFEVTELERSKWGIVERVAARRNSQLRGVVVQVLCRVAHGDPQGREGAAAPAPPGSGTARSQSPAQMAGPRLRGRGGVRDRASRRRRSVDRG